MAGESVYALIYHSWDWLDIEAIYTTREAAEEHRQSLPGRKNKNLELVEWKPWQEFDRDRYTKRGKLRAAHCFAFPMYEDEG